MKLKHDYRKVGYFVVSFLMVIVLIMLVGILATESDEISSESLFVSIISLLFALTNSLWSAIRQDMDSSDNKMINNIYQSKPYLFIEQKKRGSCEIGIRNNGKGTLFNLKVKEEKSKDTIPFGIIPIDYFDFSINLCVNSELLYRLTFEQGNKGIYSSNGKYLVCFSFENEFGDKFEQCVRIKIYNGRIITMSDKPILKTFHDNFYFLDANDYIDK